MDIVKLINNFKCPLINGIFFPNGDILVIEKNNVSIRVVCKTTVESYFLYNSVDYVTKFEILVTNSNNKYYIVVFDCNIDEEFLLDLNTREGQKAFFEIQ